MLAGDVTKVTEELLVSQYFWSIKKTIKLVLNVEVVTIFGYLSETITGISLGLTGGRGSIFMVQALVFPGMNLLWAGCALMVLGCFVAWRERLVRRKVKTGKAGSNPDLSPMKEESVLERQDKVSPERPEKLF